MVPVKKMGRESASFHTFRRFRESIPQMWREPRLSILRVERARDISGRYGKQLRIPLEMRYPVVKQNQCTVSELLSDCINCAAYVHSRTPRTVISN